MTGIEFAFSLFVIFIFMGVVELACLFLKR